MHYPVLITHYYQHSPHFGCWAANTEGIYTAQVGSQSAGEILQMQIKVQDSIIQDVKVQAYGCPYSIAAVAYLAQWVLGKSLLHLTPLSTPEIATALQLPETKLHTAVLAEDLLQHLISR